MNGVELFGMQIPAVAFYAVGLMIAFGGYSLWLASKNKKKVQAWLEQNPNAAKVYIKNKIWALGSGSLGVYSVDGEARNMVMMFSEGTKTGFYLTPGTHTITVGYQKTRASLVYQSVNTTYEPTELEIEVEAYKTYQLSFNEKEEHFDFEEKN